MRSQTREPLTYSERVARYRWLFSLPPKVESFRDIGQRWRMVLGYTGLIWLLVTSPAYAYLDPGTGGMLLQLLLGAAAMVVGKIYFSKIKAFWSSLFERRESVPEH
jgi:hypothetical protein